jgi:hypothetical protein
MSAPDPIVFLLEERRLTGKDPSALSEAVLGMGSEDAARLASALHECVEWSDTPAEPEDLDVFNFLAGSVLRGDSLCVAPECQTRQLTLLSRFSALYADSVVFPIDFSRFNPESYAHRLNLLHNVNAVSQLRPLIDAGIVRFVRSFDSLCTGCLAAKCVGVPRLESKARKFWRGRSDDFDLIYRFRERDGGRDLEVVGPADFLPHALIKQGVDIPELSQRRPRIVDGEPGVLVSKSFAKRKHLIHEEVFGTFFRDLLLQQLYGLATRATYLTNSPGQAAFFESVAGTYASGPGRADRSNAARFAASLAHSVPLFSEASISDVLKLRTEESDAFVRYRATLNKIVRDSSSDRYLSDSEFRDLYADELRPRIAELNETARLSRRNRLRRAAVKSVATALAVSLGAISGLLPSEYKALFAAAGGIGVLRDVLEVLGSPNELRSHNLYFLLRLSNHSN